MGSGSGPLDFVFDQVDKAFSGAFDAAFKGDSDLESRSEDMTDSLELPGRRTWNALGLSTVAVCMICYSHWWSDPVSAFHVSEKMSKLDTAIPTALKSSKLWCSVIAIGTSYFLGSNFVCPVSVPAPRRAAEMEGADVSVAAPSGGMASSFMTGGAKVTRPRDLGHVEPIHISQALITGVTGLAMCCGGISSRFDVCTFAGGVVAAAGFTIASRLCARSGRKLSDFSMVFDQVAMTEAEHDAVSSQPQSGIAGSRGFTMSRRVLDTALAYPPPEGAAFSEAQTEVDMLQDDATLDGSPGAASDVTNSAGEGGLHAWGPNMQYIQNNPLKVLTFVAVLVDMHVMEPIYGVEYLGLTWVDPHTEHRYRMAYALLGMIAGHYCTIQADLRTRFAPLMASLGSTAGVSGVAALSLYMALGLGNHAGVGRSLCGNRTRWACRAEFALKGVVEMRGHLDYESRSAGMVTHFYDHVKLYLSASALHAPTRCGFPRACGAELLAAGGVAPFL